MPIRFALNDVTIHFMPEEAVRIVMRLAAGNLDETELAEWFRARRV